MGFGKVASTWIAGIRLTSALSDDLSAHHSHKTHDHDDSCLVVTEPIKHVEIDLPAILLDAIVKSDVGAEGRQQHRVLGEPRSREEDVTSRDTLWWDKDLEDEVQCVGDAMSLRTVS